MEISWLEYFSGGVPSLDYFLLQIKDLTDLAGASKVATGIDTTAELCMIGLAAYFEAFCKNEFAAVVNICPETLDAFSLKRDCKVDARHLVHLISTPVIRLGFLIGEEYDFGSARSVNGLFQDLLNITPFSKSEAETYSEFLNDRNLLVHHGGIYTFKYAKKKFAAKELGDRVHFSSLVIRKDDLFKWSGFLTQLATKIGDATSTALSKFITSHGIECGPEKAKAVEALGILSGRAPATSKDAKNESQDGAEVS